MSSDRSFPDPALTSNILCQEQFLQGIQVLLVEDEPDIAELLVFVLHRVGAQVVTTTNTIEALALLEIHTPHVLLCNIKLPQHNGDWLVQQIRQHEAHTGRFLPALAVTSYSREFSAAILILVLLYCFSGCKGTEFCTELTRE